MRIAAHPQVQLVHRSTGRALQDHGIQEVRSGLENPYAFSVLTLTVGEGGGERGFTLARGGCGDKQRRAGAGRAHSSTPFCARTPASNACLTTCISVTVSASSINSGAAPRP